MATETTNMPIIPLDKIRANPWNPNEMDEKTYTALKQSMSRYGSELQPLVVREVRDFYQIIDGEHRFRAAQEIGMESLPSVIVDVDDDQAKRLTQILNRTRGKDDPAKLKELLDSLLVNLTPEEVIDGLPIADDRELESLLQELEDKITVEQFDWESFENAEPPEKEEDGDEPEEEDLQTCPECGHQF